MQFCIFVRDSFAGLQIFDYNVVIKHFPLLEFKFKVTNVASKTYHDVCDVDQQFSFYSMIEEKKRKDSTENRPYNYKSIDKTRCYSRYLHNALYLVELLYYFIY